MRRRTIQILAVLITFLAIAGLFTQGHLFGLMNVDTRHDMLRVVVSLMLIYAGFISKNKSVVNAMLFFSIALYLVIGVWGLASPTLGGLLPSGLTGFDILYHLGTAAIVLILSVTDEPARA